MVIASCAIGGGGELVYRRREAKHGHSGDAHKELIYASFVTDALTAVRWKPGKTAAGELKTEMW